MSNILDQTFKPAAPKKADVVNDRASIDIDFGSNIGVHISSLDEGDRQSSYVLPQAAETTLGGVKAPSIDSANLTTTTFTDDTTSTTVEMDASDDTIVTQTNVTYQQVKIDGNGKLWTAPQYIHKQRIASTIWTVNHNLNKYPSVTVIDSANTMVIGEVQYTNSNTLIISFSGAFSGKAYLN